MKLQLEAINKHLVLIFGIVSILVLSVSLGINLYLSKQFVEDEIINTTQITNQTLAKVFINETYPSVRDILGLEDTINDGKSRLMQGDNLQLIDQRIKMFAKGTDVMKIKIYDVKGITIYSSSHEQIGADYSQKPGFIDGLKGLSTSELTHRGTFSAIEGEVFKRDLVASYLPIIYNKQIVGVAEIYADRSDSILRANQNFTDISIYLPTMSLAVFILLFWIVWYAEKQRAKQNKKLDDINAQLITANEAKSDFLAVMSHEIRTPLNGVIATLSLINSDSLDDENRQLVNTALKSSEMLTTIINDVLDYSKIQANKFELHQEAFLINELINDIKGSYEYTIKEKGLHFDVCVEGLEDYPVFSDPIRIKQILNNYLNNAIKFTEKGTISLKAIRKGNNKVLFSVTDSGIGISQENQEALFQDFSQVHTGSTRKYQGTGLGLSICKKLAELMDGRVFVESTLGEGSTFYVELRLPKSDAPVLSKMDHNNDDHVIESPEDIHILIAEDNLVNQLIVKKLLERTPYSFEVVENGELCIDYVSNNSVDLILMDCQMPVMDGYEATRALRTNGFDKPIIALTANAQESDRNACFVAGMNDFLSKPFKKEELERVLAKNLSRQV